MAGWWIFAVALNYGRGVIRNGLFTAFGLSALACAAGCGRSTVFECVVGGAPTSLDFGGVPFGSSVSRSLTVSSQSNNGCFLSRIAMGAGSDPGFAAAQSNLGIQPDTEMSVTVTFKPQSAAVHATGTLVFQTSDPDRPSFSIPVSATVEACDLTTQDGGVNFGTVTIGDPTDQTLTLTNLGLATCEVSVAVSSSSDPGFSLPTSQATALTIAPGASSTLTVQFETGANNPPAVRTGALTITSNDPQAPAVSAPLQAMLPVCALGVIPPGGLDFGNIGLNGSATDQITLFNDGGLACNVSGLALDPTSDPDFTLPAQATAFTVAPGAQAQVSVTFSDTSGINPPFLRTGTLDFETGDLANPSAAVPLEAYVNVACVAASQWIYVVDSSSNTFARFDPATLTFTTIGTLSCPSGFGVTPFSMAVDQNAVAWVLYDSGNLFQVDTSTASCQATTFVPDQSDEQLFGMSFVFQPTTGLDTLYIAGDPRNNGSTDLATVSFPSLAVSTIAPVDLAGGELAGTGDGELWDFVPQGSGNGPVLAQLDPATAAVLTSLPLTNISSDFQSFAMKFWGGSFWIFIDNQVYQVPRATGVASLVVADDGLEIVGAGVSTCAPVQ